MPPPRKEISVLNSGSRPVTVNSVLSTPTMDSLALEFSPVKVLHLFLSICCWYIIVAVHLSCLLYNKIKTIILIASTQCCGSGMFYPGSRIRIRPLLHPGSGG
jgi:hypothetical protein